MQMMRGFLPRLPVVALFCSLLSCGGGTYTEERMAFVSVFPEGHTEVQLLFENRTCYDVVWRSGGDALPDDGSLWRLKLDIDCQIHGVLGSVDVTTLEERHGWVEELYRTKVKCDVDQVQPLVLRHCMYPRNESVGVYGIGADVIEVANINPPLQQRLRVGKRCTFSLARLIWDGALGQYQPLYSSWLVAPVVGVDCPFR